MAAAVSAALLLAACGGSAPTPEASAEPPGPVADNLPPLPEAPAPRAVSGTEIVGQQGKDAFGRGGNTQVSGSKMQLTPPPGELAWAIYELELAGFEYDELNIKVTANNPDKVWVGLADYASGSWQWTSANDIGLRMPALPEGNLSPLGSAFVCVLAFDDTFAEVETMYAEVETPDFSRQSIHAGNNFTGQFSDMELFGDRLYLAFQMSEDNFIRLARAAIEEPLLPADWELSYAVSGVQSTQVDLELVNGKPALAFAIFATGELGYGFSSKLQPTDPTNWTAYAITSMSNPISSLNPLALAEIGGRPAIAYIVPDGFENSIYYAYPSTSEPQSENDWSYEEVYKNSFPFSFHNSLDLVEEDGKPLLALRDNTADAARIYRGQTASAPAGNWDALTVFSGGGAGYPSKLVLDSQSRPALALMRRDTGQLWFAHATQSQPSEAGHWRVMYISPRGGTEMDLAVRPGGGFAIAWRTEFGNIYYAETGLTEPQYTRDWRVSEAQFNSGTVGDVSLAFIPSGTAYIAFLHDDESGDELRVLRKVD